MAVIENKTKLVMFLIVMLTIIYTMSGVFTAWALETQATDTNPLNQFNYDIPKTDTNDWNYTEQNTIKGDASETDDIMNVLYGIGSALTFTQFMNLAYIGFALTIFFNLFVMIVWALIILISLGYIHDWIPFLSG